MIEAQKINNFPEIVADCFIPLGAACRPAKWLKTYNLRYCSLPFDWLMFFTLDMVLKCIKGKSSLFRKCKEDANLKGIYRYVFDVKNKVVSMHDFPTDISMKDHMPVFQKKFQHRCDRMKKILWTYNNICFVCNRREDISKFTSFCSKLSSRYPNLSINFVNVRCSQEEKILLYKMNNHVLIYDIYANDIHKGGNDKKANSDFWLGNEELWGGICSHFSLSKKVKEQLIKEEKIDSFLKSRESFWNKFFKKINPGNL